MQRERNMGSNAGFKSWGDEMMDDDFGEPDGYISGIDEDGTEWTMAYWLGPLKNENAG